MFHTRQGPVLSSAPVGSRPLRVLLFTDADVFAGTERHMLALAASLPRERIDVSIACPPLSPLARLAEQGGIRVTPIAKGGLLDWSAIRTLRGALLRDEVDVIHAHNGRTALSARLAIGLAGRGRSVFTQHFLTPDYVARRGPASIVRRWAHAWVNRETDCFIAISNSVHDEMLKRGDCEESKVATVLNGIDFPDAKALKSRDEVRSELGIGADIPVVACVARLEPEKDLPTLIAAMKRVTDALPNALCLIAGDGAEKDALQELIEREGLAGNVRLLEFRADAASLIAAGDLFVLPSVAEPFGLVLLEAMALAKPAIATTAGGPSEIVVDGITGILVPPRDPAAMGAAILRLLKNPATAAAMGLAGRQRFEEHFTASRMAETTAEIYCAVAGQ